MFSAILNVISKTRSHQGKPIFRTRTDPVIPSDLAGRNQPDFTTMLRLELVNEDMLHKAMVMNEGKDLLLAIDISLDNLVAKLSEKLLEGLSSRLPSP